MVYENSKSFLLPGTNEAVVKQRSLGAAGAAVLASLVTTFLLNPLDVMKSQVQAASSSSQVPTAALKQSFSKLFLSGLAPRLMLSGIFGLSDSLSYEAIMYLGRATSPR